MRPASAGRSALGDYASAVSASTIPDVDAPLTGRDASEALGVYMRLDAADARFDASAVASRVRTAAGRRTILRALGVALRGARAVRDAVRPRRRERTSAPSFRASAASSAPARPRRRLGDA